MAKASFTFQRNITDNARWQDYITKFHNALVASGLTYIPIAGDLSLSSNRPANATFVGQRLYAFSDSDQESYPIYVTWAPVVVRSQDVPTYAIACGFSYNPTTGALTGNYSPGMWVNSLSTQPTDADSQTRICHGNGYLHILHNTGDSTGTQRYNGACSVIERPLTSAGNNNTGALIGHITTANSGYLGLCVPRSGTVPSHQASSAGLFGMAPWQNADNAAPWSWTVSGDTNTSLLPLLTFPFFGDTAITRLLQAPVGKITSEAIIPVGPSGQTINHFYGGDKAVFYGGTSTGLAIRWED